jgi:5-formyltetrahydrofolate cyclo-ligase
VHAVSPPSGAPFLSGILNVSIVTAKAHLRNDLAGNLLSRPEGNRAAERLRQLPLYRQAKLLYMSPAPVLEQFRTNALVDGKELLLPSPGLREGFYLLKPYSIPFPELQHAVSLKGLSQFGKRLDRAALSRTSADILLTEAVAVDEAGVILGDGKGFFDLTCAVLQESGALAADHRMVGVVSEGQIVAGSLPREPWDIQLDLILTGERCLEVAVDRRQVAAVLWEALPARRIRKIDPLWQLFQEKRKKAGE